jgi:aryl sulfotransferase
MPTPPTEYRSFVSDSRRWAQFAHRPGDIFVCTPPKCGTTWMQTIVANLLFPDGRFPAPVGMMAPWLDARFIPLDLALAVLDQQAHRRSIKTHTPADGIPWYPTGAYIVVGRGGLDTFMSFANHVASMRPDKIRELMESARLEGIEAEPLPSTDDIHAFFAAWLVDGAFFHFITSFWALRERPNVLFVHYDDMKADLTGQMRRVAAFLNLAIDESRWPELTTRCTFDYMKTHADEIGPFAEIFVGGAASFFFKGTNGRWRDVLTAAEVTAYERRAAECLPPAARAWLDRGA